MATKRKELEQNSPHLSGFRFSNNFVEMSWVSLDHIPSIHVDCSKTWPPGGKAVLPLYGYSDFQIIL